MNIKLLLISCILSILVVSYESKTVLKAATYEMTQNMLTDAPERYSKFVQWVIDYLNAYPLPYYYDHDGGHCHDSWMIDGTRAKKQLSLIPNTLKVSIEPDGIRVSARATFYISAPAYYKTSGRIIFGACWHHTVCDGIISFDTTFTISCLFKFTASGGILTITSLPDSPNIQNWNLHGCSIPHWVDWLFNVNDMINDAINKAANEAAQALVYSYSVPPEIQVSDQIVVKYYVSSLEFIPNTRVKANIDASIIAMMNTTNGIVNITYDYGDIPAGDIYPPVDWTEGPTDGSYLLDGVRVNGLLLTILIGVENMIGAFNSAKNFTILDAKLFFSLNMTTPQVLITDKDTISMYIENGTIYGTCGQQEFNENIIFMATIYNISANGSMISVQKDYAPGFYLNINSIDLDAIQVSLNDPPLPLPPSVITYIVKSQINNSVDLVNRYSRSYPFFFPARDALYVPNPELHLYTLSGTYGYIELASYCTCDGGNKAWIPCQFLCSSNKSNKSNNIIKNNTKENNV